ncbi:MAG: DUF1467 family protein [Parvularculaceae bacterium]
MNPFGAGVIYVIIWWLVFFAVLPWGVSSRWEGEDDGVKGADPGAPQAPNLKKKMIVTTGVALVFWAAAVATIVSGVVDFRR